MADSKAGRWPITKPSLPGRQHHAWERLLACCLGITYTVFLGKDSDTHGYIPIKEDWLYMMECTCPQQHPLAINITHSGNISPHITLDVCKLLTSTYVL